MLLTMFSCNNGGNKNSSNEQITDQEFKSIVANLNNSLKAENVNDIPKYSYEVTAGPEDKSTPGRVLTTPIVPDCPIPTKFSELNNGGYHYYTYDKDASASASAMGFTGSLGKHEILIVKDYTAYKTVSCNGSDKKYGIGVRCFIHVKSINGKLSYSSLPSIAANVQLNNAEAEYNFVWLGMNIGGKLVVGDKPIEGAFNVENFANQAIIFDNIVSKIDSKDSTIPISPVLLP